MAKLRWVRLVHKCRRFCYSCPVYRANGMQQIASFAGNQTTTSALYTEQKNTSPFWITNYTNQLYCSNTTPSTIVVWNTQVRWKHFWLSSPLQTWAALLPISHVETTLGLRLSVSHARGRHLCRSTLRYHPQEGDTKYKIQTSFTIPKIVIHAHTHGERKLSPNRYTITIYCIAWIVFILYIYS